MTVLAIALPTFTLYNKAGLIQGHPEPWGTGVITLVPSYFRRKFPQRLWLGLVSIATPGVAGEPIQHSFCMCCRAD